MPFLCTNPEDRFSRFKTHVEPNHYPAIIFGPENIFFLCLLHILKCTPEWTIFCWGWGEGGDKPKTTEEYFFYFIFFNNIAINDSVRVTLP